MKGKIVVPGEFLTVEEEFLPSKGSFEDGKGNIYSTKVGSSQFDELNREVRVEANKRVERLDIGTTVIGRVFIVRENVAVIRIEYAEKNGKKMVPSNNSASLMVSRVSRDFVKCLPDLFKIGDIVKAKVTEVNPYSIELTTKFPEFGVIKAYCSQCRAPLSLFDRTLKCLKCGSTETRKLSSDYAVK